MMTCVGLPVILRRGSGLLLLVAVVWPGSAAVGSAVGSDAPTIVASALVGEDVSGVVYAAEPAPEGAVVLRGQAVRDPAKPLGWVVPGGGRMAWWAICRRWLAVVRVYDPPPQEICRLLRILPIYKDAMSLAADASVESSRLASVALACEYDQSMWPFYRSVAHSAPRVASRIDIAVAQTDTLAAAVQRDGTLALWQRDMAEQPEPTAAAHPPGRWQRADQLRWPTDQPFRLLPSTHHWYFLTADGQLWQTPRQGDPGREIKPIWAAGERKVTATIIDHDLGRSFVFGDGWYLDLGDELKTVTEPAANPWPRAAAGAQVIEQLRVLRGWVDLAQGKP